MGREKGQKAQPMGNTGASLEGGRKGKVRVLSLSLVVFSAAAALPSETSTYLLDHSCSQLPPGGPSSGPVPYPHPHPSIQGGEGNSSTVVLWSPLVFQCSHHCETNVLF